jgi:hypothetical protein
MRVSTAGFETMRQIATVAENHRLRLSAGRNFKNRTSAAFVILVSPHEMNELGRHLFRVYGTAIARLLGTRMYLLCSPCSFLSWRNLVPTSKLNAYFRN